jgi:hypothetical protein
MNTRLDDPTTTRDPIIGGILVVTAVITVVGMLALIRAAVGGRVDHVIVRIDNRAGLAVQVDAVDPTSVLPAQAMTTAAHARSAARGITRRHTHNFWPPDRIQPSRGMVR